MAAVAPGDTLQLLAGTYAVNQTLRLPNSVTVRGDADGGTELRCALDVGAGAYERMLSIGGQANGTLGNPQSHYASSVARAALSHLHFRGAPSEFARRVVNCTALAVFDASSIEINNCTFKYFQLGLTGSSGFESLRQKLIVLRAPSAHEASIALRNVTVEAVDEVDGGNVLFDNTKSLLLHIWAPDSPAVNVLFDHFHAIGCSTVRTASPLFVGVSSTARANVRLIDSSVVSISAVDSPLHIAAFERNNGNDSAEKGSLSVAIERCAFRDCSVGCQCTQAANSGVVFVDAISSSAVIVTLFSSSFVSNVRRFSSLESRRAVASVLGIVVADDGRDDRNGTKCALRVVGTRFANNSAEADGGAISLMIK